MLILRIKKSHITKFQINWWHAINFLNYFFISSNNLFRKVSPLSFTINQVVWDWQKILIFISSLSFLSFEFRNYKPNTPALVTSQFLQFHYFFHLDISTGGLICLAHNLWLPSGKSSPVNTVEVKRKNRVEIKIRN